MTKSKAGQPAVAAGSSGFFHIAADDPQRLAVIGPDGGTVTYGELSRQVNQVSHGLREIGLATGDTLAVVLGNSREFLVLQLSAGQLGIVLVPVNWHFTVPEISHLLADSGTRAIVTGARFAATVAEAADTVGLEHKNRFVVADVEDLGGRDGGGDGAPSEDALPARGDGPSPRPTQPPGGPASVSTSRRTPEAFRPFGELAAGHTDARPEGRAFAHPMLYTSGTTGRPKGVERGVLEADPDGITALIADTLAAVLGLTPGTGVHLVTAPMYHASPGTHALYALHLGHTVVISPKFDAVTVLDLVRRHGVTNTFMVPTMFHRLLALPEKVRAAADTSTLRQVMHAAAACPAADKHKMIDWLGPVLIEYYGSTESAIVVVADSHEWLAHPGTVGHPVLGIDIKILDDQGAELPPGTPGMIYASVADGFVYHKDPAKTRASRRGAYYTPGDIGYLDSDGYLYLCDRRSDLIISGGVNIYPAEVEAALFEHPAVADAVVFGVPDPEWGHVVTALIQPADGAVPSDELRAELLRHCKARLARFKHPRTLEFRSALPRTPTGKLSRARVREEYLRNRD
jgi:acyl-CoA synthetase (AMP-forming)/AMP-acid ligase II